MDYSSIVDYLEKITKKAIDHRTGTETECAWGGNHGAVPGDLSSHNI